MAKRVGRKSKAQTPAPKKDQIRGSKKNVKGSAKSKESAKKIVFSDKLNNSISNKVKEYNKANPKKKITTSTAKAVVRRGMGAFSKSYRPTISGGRPNSRQAWGLARLNAFMRKKSGSTTANGVVKSSPIKKVYTQDDDLFKEGGLTYDYDSYTTFDTEQRQNISSGVHYILRGEYTLVARNLYVYNKELFHYYKYLQRLNITLEDCNKFALSLNNVFKEMVCNIKVNKLIGKKRSYAQCIIRPYNSFDSNSSYVGEGYINSELLQMQTPVFMACCTGEFLERTSGKPIPARDPKDYYSFQTLIHELAHCLDFQYQFRQNKIPVIAHKDYFQTALQNIIRACKDGRLPLAKTFGKRAKTLKLTSKLTQGRI